MDDDITDDEEEFYDENYAPSHDHSICNDAEEDELILGIGDRDTIYEGKGSCNFPLFTILNLFIPCLTISTFFTGTGCSACTVLGLILYG